MHFRSLVFLLAFLLPAALLALTPPEDPAAKLPNGTDAARKQMAAFRTPPGMKVELFAAEPMLGSPVAIAVDEKNRVYVAEEYRFNAGTEENRSRAFLLEDDLQVETLNDRLKMFQKHAKQFDGGMGWFTKHADQLRLLEDTTGSGKANKSSVLAKFNGPLDGLFAGVMATNGDVYMTCIPNLSVLKKGETTPETLLTGFGVNAAFLGHDLHGLCWGPDGKIYFSVGDRGFDVKSKEGRTFNNPRNGAVFRCNPDGTEFEVVHKGLRNPQELAFDQYGNLFADDNNCDKGDHARLVYVVEGGESGWNMAYQTIPAPYMTGPWFAERLWHLQHAGQPAYIVPPVGSIGAGPSGFLFTSGTSLPERYKNSFLMCNYTGNGGLESFKVKPVGAGFEIQDYHDFLKPIMATDAEFGYDGKLYVSDFVNLDWTGKSLGGRIYTVFDAKKIDDPVVKETKKLFAEGFEKRGADELGTLLGHADQRVRLRAQFELMKRAGKEVKFPVPVGPLPPEMAAEFELEMIAKNSKNQFARLHAIWGQLAILKRKPNHTEALLQLLQDSDAEVRAQSAKVLGDAGVNNTFPSIIKLLSDSNARVKFFAAQSLGKLKAKSAIEPLFDLLKKNADTDTYIRHACVTALVRIGEADAVAAKAKDESAAVRLAVVLIQRKLKDKRIAAALNDPDWFIRTEAARAIHDLPMTELYPELAAMLPELGKKPIPDGDPLVRRCISAAYRIGTTYHARSVLEVVTNANFSSAVRTEALGALSDWADPPPRDRVTGFWHPIGKRDAQPVRTVLEMNLAQLLAKTDGNLLTAAIATIQKLGVKADTNQFVDWAKDTTKEPSLRVASMRFLVSQKAELAAVILDDSLNDRSATVRAEARELIAKNDAKRGSKLLEDVVRNKQATMPERQRAFVALMNLKTAEANSLLDEYAAVLPNQVPDALKLEVIEAIATYTSPLRTKAKQAFDKTLPGDPMGKLSHAIVGGDAERGREIFFNHTAAQCVRCHTVNGTGGTAGPDLSKIASKYPEKMREHLFESMILPSAKIADGFASVTLSLLDGRVVAGTVMKEDAKMLSVKDANGKLVNVSVADIETRTKPTSPMPSVERTLNARELRDLVEYLTTLK